MQAGVSHDCPEMLHFDHSAFLIARECCYVNLGEEASWLLELASQAGHRDRKVLRDIRLFRLMIAVFGCRRAVRLSERLHRIRSHR